MKFLAEDFNRPKFVACFKMVNYQAVFKNGKHAGPLGKLTQQAVIIFGKMSINIFTPLELSIPKLSESLSNTPVL